MIEMYSDRDRNLKDQPSIDASKEEAQWWETAEDHRFALEVLQQRLRRDILKFISQGPRTEEDIAKKFSINGQLAKYHLDLLEKALVINRAGSFFQLTSTGALYLNNVDKQG